MSKPVPERRASSRRHGVTALLLSGIVVGMVGLSFASVPLYRLFCQVTGFGGTTQVASTAPSEVLPQTVTVRFNADVAPGMPWTFEPVQRDMTVQIGETGLAFYRAHNKTDRPITGMASFNVTRDAAVKPGSTAPVLKSAALTVLAAQSGLSVYRRSR